MLIKSFTLILEELDWFLVHWKPWRIGIKVKLIEESLLWIYPLFSMSLKKYFLLFHFLPVNNLCLQTNTILSSGAFILFLIFSWTLIKLLTPTGTGTCVSSIISPLISVSTRVQYFSYLWLVPDDYVHKVTTSTIIVTGQSFIENCGNLRGDGGWWKRFWGIQGRR